MDDFKNGPQRAGICHCTSTNQKKSSLVEGPQFEKNIGRSLSNVSKSPETLHMRITNTQYCHLYVLKSRDPLFTSEKGKD